MTESCPNSGPAGYFCSLRLDYFGRIRHAEAFIKVFPRRESVRPNDTMDASRVWCSTSPLGHIEAVGGGVQAIKSDLIGAAVDQIGARNRRRFRMKRAPSLSR